MEIMIDKKTPSINHMCINCGGEILPTGKNGIVGKNRKYCGSKVCQSKRLSVWYQKRKNLEYVKEIVKEMKRINQRNYCKQERVKLMYKKYMKEYGKIYVKRKRREDEYFNGVERLRDRFRKSLRKALENKRCSDYYGINFHEIAEFIGLCPGLRKDYEIDHIKPLCSFDLTKLSEIKKAFAPKNHQWLKKELNRKKGGKYGGD